MSVALVHMGVLASYCDLELVDGESPNSATSVTSVPGAGGVARCRTQRVWIVTFKTAEALQMRERTGSGFDERALATETKAFSRNCEIVVTFVTLVTKID